MTPTLQGIGEYPDTPPILISKLLTPITLLDRRHPDTAIDKVLALGSTPITYSIARSPCMPLWDHSGKLERLPQDLEHLAFGISRLLHP